MSEPAVRVRCLVADDHPAVVAAVSALIHQQTALELVGSAADGREAMRQIGELDPDIAILDVQMPVQSGIAVAQELSLRRARTAVILYTAFPERESLHDALEAGVRGFVLKESPLADLARAIAAVAAGRPYVDPSLAGTLSDSTAVRRLDTLSAREREVLALVADGMRSQAIAAHFALSHHTVRAHVDSAMKKLEADNRTHAVAMALRRSLIA